VGEKVIERVFLEENVEIKLNLLAEIPTLPVKLIFDEKRQIEDNLRPAEGISKYGPYDHSTSIGALRRDFDSIEIFVFYPAGENIIRDGLSLLMRILSDGYKRKRKVADLEFRGLKDEFRLKNVSFPEPNEFVEYKVGSLRSEVEKHVQEIKGAFRGRNKPIVIIGGSTHKSVFQNREQYIEAKKVFTSLEIPSQYVSYYEYSSEGSGAGLLYQVVKDSQKHDVPLGNSIWNLCLNIYGKVGGIAWVVKQKVSPSEDKIVDLSIGLRFAISKEYEGYSVGYATILDRFGRLIGTITSRPIKVTGMEIPKEDMREYVSKILETAINDPRIKSIYEEARRELNISVHRLNFFSLREMEGIKEAISEFKQDRDFREIKYSLVPVIKKPTFILFDRTTKSGNVVRGTAYRINEKSAILYTAGLLSASDERAMTYPIIVCCQNLGEEDSIFKSLEEVCNHILNLSALHWQTVIPASIRLPATLEFAQNIANLDAYGVYPPINSWINRTLWFI
jgi:hypothetical protein